LVPTNIRAGQRTQSYLELTDLGGYGPL
jgi:hypothetical protein